MATFQAYQDRAYAVDTSGDAYIAYLPTAPTASRSIGFADYNNTFGTNALTIHAQTKKIEGSGSPLILNTSGDSCILTYIDETVGWIVTG
jgi:hypothetical protein